MVCNKDKNGTFCVLPWIHSYVNSNGAYQICCASDDYHYGIPDNDGVVFNIENRPKMETIMNSNFMKKLRLEMLNGDWNSACTRCRESEILDGESRRQIENQKSSVIIERLIKNTNIDGEIEIELKTLDYRLGNNCNLQCRMCSPFSSDKWLANWNEIMPKVDRLSDDELVEYSNFNWSENEILLSEFREKVKRVERLHFGGGEPFISSGMIKILEECIQENVSKNIILSYNTNITVLPMKTLNLWKEFKEVRLLCSVDGHDLVNDYIRFPSKWKTIDKNLKFLDENAEKYNIVEITLSCTVQLYNVLNLSDLFLYVQNFKKIKHKILLNNLHYPLCFSTQVLPRSVKELATSRLSELVKNILFHGNEYDQSDINNIYEVINFMNLSDQSAKLSIFKTINAKMNDKMKCNMIDYIPELNSLLTEYYLENMTN